MGTPLHMSAIVGESRGASQASAVGGRTCGPLRSACRHAWVASGSVVLCLNSDAQYGVAACAMRLWSLQVPVLRGLEVSVQSAVNSDVTQCWAPFGFHGL